MLLLPWLNWEPKAILSTYLRWNLKNARNFVFKYIFFKILINNITRIYSYSIIMLKTFTYGIAISISLGGILRYIYPKKPLPKYPELCKEMSEIL